jgi:hypothetical protein
VVEHFNDVWDKSFFRTERFAGLDHLRPQNAAFAEFHNAHHRYSVHKGAPDELWSHSHLVALSREYRVPTSLPARGRIEVVRYVRSNRVVNLFGRRITVAEEHVVTPALRPARSSAGGRGPPDRMGSGVGSSGGRLGHGEGLLSGNVYVVDVLGVRLRAPDEFVITVSADHDPAVTLDRLGQWFPPGVSGLPGESMTARLAEGWSGR